MRCNLTGRNAGYSRHRRIAPAPGQAGLPSAAATRLQCRDVTASTSAAETWTTRRLLHWTTEFFTRKSLDSPRLCAELLLAHVIGCERMRLYMETERPAAPEELKTLRGLVERAGRHEPVQYLLGEAWFYTRPFAVTPAVLIPRPATERIVEEVLQTARAGAQQETAMTVIDIGTGSGILAVTLAAVLPAARIIATDICAEALAVARGNAARHGVTDRIEFVEGSLLEPLADRRPPVRADVLVSNPPYISDSEWDDVAPNVRDYEPALALRAGADGLDILRPLIAEAHHFIRPGGRLLLEIAASQEAAVNSLAAVNPALSSVRVLKDYEDLPRVLSATTESHGA